LRPCWKTTWALTCRRLPGAMLRIMLEMLEYMADDFDRKLPPV
jgi:hypothetical protein